MDTCSCFCEPSIVALEVAPDVRLRALAARSVQAACKGVSVCMYV